MNERDDVSFSADLDFSISIQKNTSNKIRQIFDNVSLNVISFLEKHRGVTDVKFFERPPVSQKEIDEWEKKYYPCKLPDDYKSFLLISNGFLLHWHMKYNKEVLPLGNISLSSLQSLKPVKFGNENEIFAFSLDSNDATDGTVAFVFNNDANHNINPSIWFEDFSCEWNFICHTFSDYFRLMIIHLGLINWQYAFTKVGLNPSTMQWLRFLVPKRLDLDLRHNANGFGWILPKKSKKNDRPKLKRKKICLNKIDQIVNAQFSKDNKSNIKLTLPNKSRPRTAPNNGNKKTTSRRKRQR